MKFTEYIKNILPSCFVSISCISLISLLYISIYAYVQHGQYLDIYQKSQQEELAVAQQKTKAVLEKLNELLLLTSARVKASQGDINKIQAILSSTPRLYTPQELPKIKNLSYYKYSHPQMTVTRLGTFLSEHKTIPLLDLHASTTSVLFNDSAVVGKVPIFDEGGNAEGILEVQVSLADFKSFVGEARALSFDLPVVSKENKDTLLQKNPFPLYAKNPESFWKFVFAQKANYSFYFVYSFIVLFCLAVAIAYLFWKMKRAYRAILHKFKNNLLKSQSSEEQLAEELILFEQKYKSHQAYCQSNKSTGVALKERQKEQVLHVHQSLKILEQALRQSEMAASLEYHLEIVQSCLRSTDLLVNDLLSREKKELINFKNLLEDIRKFFTEKMYKANATFELTCPNKLVFYGDYLFTKLILINVIGKAIHRVPKNGKISLNVEEQDKVIHFNLRDKGFELIEATKQHIKRSFDFVIAEDVLQKMCQESGLGYTYGRDENGCNINEILIPLNAEEPIKNNVIRLFT